MTKGTAGTETWRQEGLGKLLRGFKWWVAGIQHASLHPWKTFLSDPSGQGVSSSLPVCLRSMALKVLSD